MSPRLNELSEKKKWLVKDGNYAKAIRINEMINNEKKRLLSQKEERLNFSLNKKVECMKKKN